MSARDLAAIGGPLGRHAQRRWFAALVWPFVLLAAVPMQLAMFQKAYCIDHGWTGTEQFWRACFSDLPVQYQAGGLSGGLPAYLSGDATLAHPPLTGAVMSLVGGLVGDGTFVAQQRQYFLLWAVLATALLMGIVWLTAATRPHHTSLAAQVALSPVVVTAALASSDIVGVALVSAGLFAWARRRPALAGALLGLGVTARTYPVLVLAIIVVLGIRAGRLEAVRRLLAGAGVAIGAVVAFFAVVNPRALTEAYTTWWSAPAGLGSPWLVPQLVGHPLPSVVVTVLAVLGMLAAIVAGVLLALVAPRRPSIAQVAVVVVGIVLVTGASFPVQSSLWLLPLVALAGVPWRDHLVWAGAEALNFVAVWLYSGGLSRPDRGLPPGWYALFSMIRVAAVLYLVWRVWRTVMATPAHDPDPAWPDDPDRDALVDESAGPLTDAPDALVAAFR